MFEYPRVVTLVPSYPHTLGGIVVYGLAGILEVLMVNLPSARR